MYVFVATQELEALLKDLIPNFKLKSLTNNFREWSFYVFPPKQSLYEKDIFILKIKFPYDYPYNPPSAYFIKEKYLVDNTNAVTTSLKNSHSRISAIPKHPHIYSNGDICLSVLGSLYMCL